MLSTVVHRIHCNFFEFEGIFGPVIDVVKVDGTVEFLRPQPLQVNVSICLAAEVGDDGRARPREVCGHDHGLRRFALVPLRVGLRPYPELGVGLCKETTEVLVVNHTFRAQEARACTHQKGKH